MPHGGNDTGFLPASSMVYLAFTNIHAKGSCYLMGTSTRKPFPHIGRRMIGRSAKYSLVDAEGGGIKPGYVL
jgi:hypothetical protein